MGVIRNDNKEDALESEKAIKLIVESNPDACFLHDMEGIFIEGNGEALKIVGYNRDELVGKSFLKCGIIKKSDIPKVAAALMKTVLGKTVKEETYTLIRKDGKEVVAEVTSIPLKLGGKKFVFNVMRDVTEKKRDEHILRQNEERYRIITEQTGQMMYDYDLPTGKIVWTGAITAITGYTPKEYEAVDIKKWGEFIHPDDRKYALKVLEYSEMEGGNYLVSYRYRRKDGSYIRVEDKGAFILDPKGNAIRMLGVLSDITERKKAEEESTKLAMIVQYTDELVNMATPEGVMVFLNMAGSEMLGIAPEDVSRYRIMDVIPVDYADEVKNKVLPALFKDGKWEGDLQYRNVKTGKTTDVHAHTFVIKDKSGKLLYLANVSMDMSKSRKSEKELRERNEELEKINKLMIGRELKMNELKMKIKELENKLQKYEK